MPDRHARLTRSDQLSAALMRVSDVAFLNPGDLQRPSNGLKMAIRIARSAGATWQQIATLTGHTATELEGMDDDGTFQP
jgi:hypothetical protein